MPSILLILFSVDSPGIAYFYGATSSAQEALIKAFLTSWPVLVVVLLFALVVGSGFWVTVSKAHISICYYINCREILLKKKYMHQSIAQS